MTSLSMPEFTAYETWRDDFDGPAGRCQTIAYSDSSLEPGSFWVTDIGDGSDGPGPGWGNNELEYYTDGAVSVDGAGNLVITASRTNDENGPDGWRDNERWQYVSGKITSAGRVGFQYGLIEARVQVPTALGSWSAFWLLGESLLSGVPWPQCGEIDVLEAVGQEPTKLLGTVHGPGYFADAGLTCKIDAGADLEADFHTFSVLWLPDEIYWMFDGRPYHHLSAADAAPNPWVFNESFYMIVNLAMGGNLGGPLSADVHQAQMRVDYVRHCAVQLAGQAERIGAVTFH